MSKFRNFVPDFGHKLEFFGYTWSTPVSHGTGSINLESLMSDIFTESTTQLMKRGRVKTSSRLQVFWLSRAKGFKIERRLRTPVGYSFGKLNYKTVWILRPKNNE